MFAKFLIDKISKYCIVPGLDLYCHLNGKVSTILSISLMSLITSITFSSFLWVESC